jgi:hypothetical protein
MSMAMALDEVLLAAADIRDQGQGEGHVQAARKERNALWNAVFEHLEIVLRQVARQRAMRVAHCKGHVHQVDVHADARLIRGHRGGGQTEYGEQWAHTWSNTNGRQARMQKR